MYNNAFNGDQECPENSYSTQRNDAVIDLLRTRGVFYSWPDTWNMTSKKEMKVYLPKDI